MDTTTRAISDSDMRTSHGDCEVVRDVSFDIAAEGTFGELLERHGTQRS